MVIRRYSDRITLCLIEDKNFKSNYVSLDIEIPLERATVTEAALIPNVVLRGTKSCPDMLSLAKKLDWLYGASLSADCKKAGNNLVLNFTVSFLKDRYAVLGGKVCDESLGLLFETVTSPAFVGGIFKKEYVESEITNLREKIRAEINDKRRYTVKCCLEKLCDGDPFGLSPNGIEEDLCKITPESLTKRYYAILSDSKIFAFSFGECDETVLCEKLLKSFDKDAVFTLPNVTEKKIKDKAEYFKEEMAVSQAKLALGFRSDILKDFSQAEIKMFSGIYNAGTTSKLFMNVREKLSLCYYCAAMLYRSKGIMIVDSGILPENYEKALGEIQNQLSDVANKLVTENEYTSALKLMKNTFTSVKDSADALHGWYHVCWHNGEFITPEEMTEALGKVTVDKIAELAKSFRLQTVYLVAPKEVK